LEWQEIDQLGENAVATARVFLQEPFTLTLDKKHRGCEGVEVEAYETLDFGGECLLLMCAGYLLRGAIGQKAREAACRRTVARHGPPCPIALAVHREVELDDRTRCLLMIDQVLLYLSLCLLPAMAAVQRERDSIKYDRLARSIRPEQHPQGCTVET